MNTVDTNICQSAYEEAEMIRSAVTEFMHAICKAIGECENEMNCMPVLVGSAKENTRSFAPDEYDFLIVFEAITQYFDINEILGQFLFRLKPSFERTCANISYLTEYENIKYLNPHDFRKRLNSIVCRIMHMDVSSLWKPIQIPLNASRTGYHLSRDSRLTINPVGFYTEKPGFSTINLEWKGNYFRSMQINVDIVPAFPYNETITLPHHDFISGFEQLYIIVHGYPIGYQFGFSAIENGLILSLPPYVQEGYRYAKAMRCAFVLSGTTELEQINNYEDLITSYMLKTSLFFVTRDSVRNYSSHSTNPIHWAMRIYTKLQEFLEEHGRVPNFFLNDENKEDRECLFRINPKQIYLRVRERRNMLLAIETILDFLRAKVKTFHISILFEPISISILNSNI